MRARAARRDRGAFDALVKATYDRAYTVAYHLVRSREDAKDIVQEAFIRVQKHLPDFQHEASFNTWLYRVVVNLGLDWHRRRKFVDPKVETNDLVVADKRINPEDEAAGHELGALLEAGLQTLSPDHRAALVLFEVEGLSSTKKSPRSCARAHRHRHESLVYRAQKNAEISQRAHAGRGGS